MADIEKKLADFSNVILSEAQAQKEKAVKELEDKKKHAVGEKETELLKDAYEDIQRAVSKYSKEENERILKHEMAAKKQVLKMREDIIDEVFSEVKSKLDEFVSSPEYKDWLVNLAKKACAEIGVGEIRISQKDSAYKEDLEKAVPGCTVMPCGNDFTGGLAARCGNLSVDYTIKEMLDEKRSGFLKTSGLNINA